MAGCLGSARHKKKSSRQKDRLTVRDLPPVEVRRITPVLPGMGVKVFEINLTNLKESDLRLQRKPPTNPPRTYWGQRKSAPFRLAFWKLKKQEADIRRVVRRERETRRLWQEQLASEMIASQKAVQQQKEEVQRANRLLLMTRRPLAGAAKKRPEVVKSVPSKSAPDIPPPLLPSSKPSGSKSGNPIHSKKESLKEKAERMRFLASLEETAPAPEPLYARKTAGEPGVGRHRGLKLNKANPQRQLKKGGEGK